MNFPNDLKYTKDHEWVRLSGSSGTIGITEFAQQELGEVVFADLPAIGKTVKQGDSVVVVESTKAASDVYAPVGGVVKEVNTALGDKSQLINESPYDKGWLVKLENISNDDVKKLMSADEYSAYVSGKSK